VDLVRDAVAGYELEVKQLTDPDFEAAFEAVGRPETAHAELAHFERWRAQGE
jgi:hypothetical protein